MTNTKSDVPVTSQTNINTVTRAGFLCLKILGCTWHLMGFDDGRKNHVTGRKS